MSLSRKDHVSAMQKKQAKMYDMLLSGNRALEASLEDLLAALKDLNQALESALNED